MTRTLTPRIPAAQTGEPARPPLVISPRAALAAAAAVALLAAAFALAFKPAKLPATERVAAARYSVQMAGYAFAPASITVNEGDTITWTNQDTAPHTVTTTSGPERLNSPYLSKGQSWSHTFTAPGVYMYYCTVHPDMRAEVIVQAPAPATSAAPRVQSQSSPPPAQAAVPAHVHAAATSARAVSSTSAAAVAPVAPSSSSPTPAATALQAQQSADSSGIRSVSPVLLLGGLTAAIAVFCLLLVGSRAAPAAASSVGGASPDTDGGDSDDYDY